MNIFRFGIALALSLATTTMAATPNRIGPVTQYGQLQADKNASNQGRIYGSCKDYNKQSGNAVKVRGMSLYWSLLKDATDKYYTEQAIDAMVSEMNIEVIRFAMGTASDWGNKGYDSDPYTQESLLKTVVEAAIKNDIYVIIDWHSHTAHTETQLAKKFFKKMAQTYGGYNNVIFEIYNEPAKTCHTATGADDECEKSNEFVTWSTVKSYAEEVIPVIREYSDNLIVVGTPSWSADLSGAAQSPLTGYSNIAYTFHYYGSTHTVSNQGNSAANAIKRGLSVFVTEWGVCEASGNGSINNEENTKWQNWMNTYELSAANWSASQVNEACAAFTQDDQGKGSLMNETYYTTSGSMVKGYLSSNPTSYSECESGYEVPEYIPDTPTIPQDAEDGSDIIDDLEDGDNFPYTPGEWIAYTDNTSKDDDGNSPNSTIGNSSKTVKGQIAYDITFPNLNESNYVAGLQDIKLVKGDYMYDPYVTLALNLNKDDGYNLSSCTAIKYEYKGAAHNFKAVMAGDFDGKLTEYNNHHTKVNASGTWTTAVIDWGDLYQDVGWGKEAELDKTNIGRFSWEVKDKTYNYLFVDNIRCNGTKIERPASSASTDDISSSSGEILLPPTSASSGDISSSSDDVPLPPTSASSGDINSSSDDVPLPPTSASSGDISSSSDDVPLPPTSASSASQQTESSSSMDECSDCETTTITKAQAARAGYTISRQDNTLSIYSPNGSAFKVEMFDIMGNTVMKTRATGSISLQLNNMLSGTYLVRISGKSGASTIKVNVK
ncbi:Por secretion system C-terminal sorting domain-containing protein [Fibrobacter sp. UWH9]|uniref:cellulase family glycosylhydrolase n=1 Tax=Fibrobacter sp. UWH9 TaxID=1896213 RepID=UPI00090EED25|nr:cellulase family glycosylhydrolase [Fibrobacter sp. UWH9]SHG97950.1 Por secretion system C-terminal sorting domain-containing protein [Fibrobacter sp. UWH9]